MFKKLPELMKKPKVNANINCLKKGSICPDNIIPKRNRSVSDPACNHPQTDNS